MTSLAAERGGEEISKWSGLLLLWGMLLFILFAATIGSEPRKLGLHTEAPALLETRVLSADEPRHNTGR